MTEAKTAYVKAPTARTHESAGAGGPSALLHLLRDSPDCLAIVDANAVYLHVNASGCSLLGQPESALVGTVSPWRRSEAPSEGPYQLVSLGRREVSYALTEVQVGESRLGVVQFRDVTEARQRERHLRTFAQTAASIAFAEDLSTLLNRLAEEVRHATGMYSCTFLLYDETGELQQSGTAGDYPRAHDYSLRLRRCRDLGAPLLADEAVRQKRPIIAPGWRQRTLDDARFAPIHEFSRDAVWNTIVVVPLLVRGHVAGVFNGFYLTDDEPHEADLPFLTAIADQAAIAVDNSQLLAAAERQAALEERHRLARELHDSVSQALFSLSLQARALELTLGRSWPAIDAGIKVSLHEINGLITDALVEMRALIFQLRPAALREEGLLSAVRKHASALAAREGLNVTVRGRDAEVVLDAAIEEQLFRVIQEALHNVVKHVPGGQVSIDMSTAGDDGSDLVVTITDDGAGFDPELERPGHYGLQTMAERVEQSGGTLTVQSRTSGTTVCARLPGVLIRGRR